MTLNTNDADSLAAVAQKFAAGERLGPEYDEAIALVQKFLWVNEFQRAEWNSSKLMCYHVDSDYAYVYSNFEGRLGLDFFNLEAKLLKLGVSNFKCSL